MVLTHAGVVSEFQLGPSNLLWVKSRTQLWIVY